MIISTSIPYDFSPEQPGQIIDFGFLEEDKWLVDTEVKYILLEKKGQWHLTMIYIAVENPLKLLCKRIDAYHTAKKAMIYASILQRSMRKDNRGTLKSNVNAFNLCDN